MNQESQQKLKILKDNSAFALDVLDLLEEIQVSPAPIETVRDYIAVLQEINSSTPELYLLDLNEEQSERLDTASCYIVEALRIQNNIDNNITKVKTNYNHKLLAINELEITDEVYRKFMSKVLSCYLLFISDLFTYEQDFKDLSENDINIICGNMKKVTKGLSNLKDIIDEYVNVEFFSEENIKIGDDDEDEDMDDLEDDFNRVGSVKPVNWNKFAE